MSIYGTRATALNLMGLPGRPYGRGADRLMINIELPLHIAGASPTSFTGTEDVIIPPAQIAQQGDGDIVIVLSVVDANNNPIDISAATELTLLMRKPDLTQAAYVAALTNSGRDGKMSYALDATDLDEAGFYYFQGSFTIAGGVKSTQLGKLKVAENIVPDPL